MTVLVDNTDKVIEKQNTKIIFEVFNDLHQIVLLLYIYLT